MTNLKKVGLTALAGTLATLTAHAGEMSVSGTAKMTYSSNTDSTVASGTQPNGVSSEAFGTNSSIVFSGSGELDNGFMVSVSSNITDGATTAAHMTLDMGDMGKLSMDDGKDLAGLPAYQDKVPNAGEQVWDDNTAAHGTPAQGITNPRADESDEDALGYSVSMSGITVSSHLQLANANGTESSVVVVADGLVDGLAIGAGQGNNQSSATNDDDLETYFITYAMGGFTVGMQNSKVDAQTANTDIERDAYGVSFAVNENLSISYGVSETTFSDTSITSDEENSGISASYTAGGMTVGLVHNKKDNAGGTTGTNQERTELALTFAF